MRASSEELRDRDFKRNFAGRSEADFQKFNSLPPETPQSVIQNKLAEVYRKYDLSEVLEYLFRWELKTGYITEDKLQSKETNIFRDSETGVNFRLQINYARSDYKPEGAVDSSLPRLHCAICKENVGRPGKEGLRVFEFPLGATPFFIQLTPFPLFPYHYVLILREPQPQRICGQSLAEMFEFLSLAPEYTVCSNSDVEWAGSSILVHQHFQVFKNLHLPVMEARPCDAYFWMRKTSGLPSLKSQKSPPSFSGTSCTTDYLDYPMAALRVSSARAADVEKIGTRIIETWKSASPAKNTANLVLRLDGGVYNLFIFLRNPDYRTPPRLTHLKSEGVGVIEASGEIILPVPASDEDWHMVRERGLEVIRGIIEGNSPIKRGEERNIRELFEPVLR